MNRKEELSAAKKLLNQALRGEATIHRCVERSWWHCAPKKRVLGKGSAGIVYESELGGRPVAVKVLQDLTQAEEFRQEVLLLSVLKHDNIVELIGANLEDEDESFMVLELCTRGSLRDVCERHRRKNDSNNANVDDENYSNQENDGDNSGAAATANSNSDSVVFSAALGLASALDYLHALGFLHSDLKSLNVLVTHDWVAKLTDFGTAARRERNQSSGTGVGFAPSLLYALSSSLAASSTPSSSGDEALAGDGGASSSSASSPSPPAAAFSGSLPWMERSVLDGEPYDRLSDIYALGMLFYELVRNRTPFEELELGPAELCEHIRQGGTPNWSLVEPTASIDQNLIKLADVGKQCTHLDRTKRPSLRVVVRELTALLHAEQVLTPRQLPPLTFDRVVGSMTTDSDPMLIASYAESLLVLSSSRFALICHALLQHTATYACNLVEREGQRAKLRRVISLGSITPDRQRAVITPAIRCLLDKWRRDDDPVGFGLELHMLITNLSALFGAARSVLARLTDEQHEWLRINIAMLERDNFADWICRSIVGHLDSVLRQILDELPSIRMGESIETVYSDYWHRQLNRLDHQLVHNLDLLIHHSLVIRLRLDEFPRPPIDLSTLPPEPAPPPPIEAMFAQQQQPQQQHRTRVKSAPYPKAALTSSAHSLASSSAAVADRPPSLPEAPIRDALSPPLRMQSTADINRRRRVMRAYAKPPPAQD
jgi:serine/threonine protein kinase